MIQTLLFFVLGPRVILRGPVFRASALGMSPVDDLQLESLPLPLPLPRDLALPWKKKVASASGL